jgi:hypothetical protein
MDDATVDSEAVFDRLKTEIDLLKLEIQKKCRPLPPVSAESESDDDDKPPRTFDEIVEAADEEQKTVRKIASDWRESGEGWKCLLREPLYELDDTAHRVLRLRSARMSMPLVQSAKNSLIKARNSLDNIINFINQ